MLRVLPTSRASRPKARHLPLLLLCVLGGCAGTNALPAAHPPPPPLPDLNPYALDRFVSVDWERGVVLHQPATSTWGPASVHAIDLRSGRWLYRRDCSVVELVARGFVCLEQRDIESASGGEQRRTAISLFEIRSGERLASVVKDGRLGPAYKSFARHRGTRVYLFSRFTSPVRVSGAGPTRWTVGMLDTATGKGWVQHHALWAKPFVARAKIEAHTNAGLRQRIEATESILSTRNVYEWITDNAPVRWGGLSISRPSRFYARGSTLSAFTPALVRNSRSWIWAFTTWDAAEGRLLLALALPIPFSSEGPPISVVDVDRRVARAQAVPYAIVSGHLLSTSDGRMLHRLDLDGEGVSSAVMHRGSLYLYRRDFPSVLMAFDLATGKRRYLCSLALQ